MTVAPRPAPPAPHMAHTGVVLGALCVYVSPSGPVSRADIIRSCKCTLGVTLTSVSWYEEGDRLFVGPNGLPSSVQVKGTTVPLVQDSTFNRVVGLSGSSLPEGVSGDEIAEAVYLNIGRLLVQVTPAPCPMFLCRADDVEELCRLHTVLGHTVTVVPCAGAAPVPATTPVFTPATVVSSALSVSPPSPPSAPRVVDPAPAMPLTGGVKRRFFVLHDSENNVIPNDTPYNFSQIRQEVEREALRVLFGEAEVVCYDRVGAVRAAAERHWTYISRTKGVPTEFLPSNTMLDNMVKVGLVDHILAANKKDGVDTLMKRKLSQFVEAHRCDPEAVKAEWIIVVLSGDSDFLTPVVEALRLGFNIVMIHGGNAAAGLESQCHASAQWRVIAGGTFRERSAAVAAGPNAQRVSGINPAASSCPSSGACGCVCVPLALAIVAR